MNLERTRRRIRAVRDALATLASIYRRDRNLGQIIGKVWWVAMREGLNGVKYRVVQLSHLDDPPAEVVPAPLTYQQWVERFDPLRERQVPAVRRHLAALSLPDLLMIIVVTHDDVTSLGRMVASWRESIHAGWRAVLIASSDLSGSDIASLDALAALDPRISVARTPEEVEAAGSRFDYTLLCFGRVLLNSFSIYMFLEAATRTGADIVYSDSDRIDEAGQRVDPAFKPQFSPEYVARYNYIGDCLLLSRSAGLTAEASCSLFHLTLADYDRFVARLVLGRRVEHLPFVLFHVLDDPPRMGHDLPVIEDRGPGVAIIIPTRDGLDHLKPCIDSILKKTSYDLSLVEIVVVDNNSSETATLEYLAEIVQHQNIAVVRYPFPFNFAAIVNFGAQQTRKEVIVFLNDDTVVHDPGWLSKLVWYASKPDVGIVGAKLLFPDGTVQHGGCVAGGNMGTVSHLLTYADPTAVAASDRTREMTLVTAACCAVRREVFEQVGGFDPILGVTWNDVKFCLDCLHAGFRNIYIADPLLYHYESKSRGRDDTRERTERYFDEAHYTRRLFRTYFYDDPSYNPNLSVETAGQFADPPRVRRPWSRPQDQPRRILVLSTVYKIGFGVPLVIQQQVRKLKSLGYEVVIGGPIAENEFAFPGCERVALGSAKDAAIFAFETDVSLIISHTPPYFEIPVVIGAHIPVLAYDYGEPSPSFFQEPVRSYLVNVESQKRSSAALTTVIATISQAVKDETLNDDAIVIGLANSHLPAWSEALRPQRDNVRHQLGWEYRFVILTVCRFYENERAYKGLDKIGLILRKFPYLHPGRSKDLVWALAGAGSPDDVEQVEALGFTVFPNVSDEMLIDLYMAADAYMGFSRWEGYNLGISQALAMGLPTAASDIPAHREFPIFTSNSTLAVSNWLADKVVAQAAAKHDRRAIVYQWEDSTKRFGQVVEQILQRAAIQTPRFGASLGTQQGARSN
jgi:GT2 family glycosyltransferase